MTKQVLFITFMSPSNPNWLNKFNVELHGMNIQYDSGGLHCLLKKGSIGNPDIF
jgi:hypothetical protein